MRNLLFMLAAALVFAACGNKHVSPKTEEIAEINNSVLGVSLNDNRAQAIKKIEEQGYKVEDQEMFLTMEERFSFSGYYFDKLSLAIFDAKVFFITVSSEFESEESAKKQYAELESKLMDKYAKFKTNNTNDGFLVYTEFDDKKTNLSLSILYHPKEDVPPLLQDEETLHNAREYWELLLMYNPSKDNPGKEKTNDF